MDGWLIQCIHVFFNVITYDYAYLCPCLLQDLDELGLVAGLEEGFRALGEVLVEGRPRDGLTPASINDFLFVMMDRLIDGNYAQN